MPLERFGGSFYLPGQKMKEQLPLDQYFLDKADEIERKSRPGETVRAQVAVTMTRRFRGKSASDRFGYFDPRPGHTGWLGDHRDDTELLATMRHLPVIKPAVRANMAAMVTARVRLLVAAASKQPALAGAAGVAEGVIEFLDGHREHWSDTLEGRISQMCQLSWGYFIRSRHNPKKRGPDRTETDWSEEEETYPGEYACKCGAGGMFEGEVAEDEGSGMPVTVCPECGETAEVVEGPRPEKIDVPSYKRVNAGDSETTVVSSYNARVDERDSQGGNLNGALWFEHHYLQSSEVIEAENPGYEPGTAAEWSFPVKWQRALESGDDACLKWGRGGWNKCEEHEVRDIYLRPEEYTNRGKEQLPFAWKDGRGAVMVNEGGEPVFAIEAGERLIDRFPDGLRYRVTKRELLPGSPEEPGLCARDFRREFAYGGYMPDAFSFWMHPATELDTLQNDANNYYTIDAMYRERNSVNTLVADGMAFDEDAFEHDIAFTKEGFDLGLDGDIKRRAYQLQTPSMPQAMEGLRFLFEITPSIGGGNQPAAVGAPQPGEPYAAQLLQRQSALGLLAPSQQSKAQAKCEWGRQQLRAAQSWPPERFDYLRSRFGEEWKDEDVEAFLNCDIERDLIVSYVEGSEIPTSLIERDLKYRDFLTQMVALASAMQRPDLIKLDMIAQAAELAGVDYDVGNAEADKRLAKSRFDAIKKGLKNYASLPPEEAFALTMANPQLRVLPKENHGTHIEFYSDQERALMAEEVPDELLVEACEEMILRHERGGVAQNQAAQADDIASNAPQMAAGAMMGGGQGGPEQGTPEAQQPDPEQERAAADEEHFREEQRAEDDREHEREMKDKELVSRERIAAIQSQAKQEARPSA
jgi:hypothetical protein